MYIHMRPLIVDSRCVRDSGRSQDIREGVLKRNRENACEGGRVKRERKLSKCYHTDSTNEISVD